MYFQIKSRYHVIVTVMIAAKYLRFPGELFAVTALASLFLALLRLDLQLSLITI